MRAFPSPAPLALLALLLPISIVAQEPAPAAPSGCECVIQDGALARRFLALRRFTYLTDSTGRRLDLLLNEDTVFIWGIVTRAKDVWRVVGPGKPPHYVRRLNVRAMGIAPSEVLRERFASVIDSAPKLSSGDLAWVEDHVDFRKVSDQHAAMTYALERSHVGLVSDHKLGRGPWLEGNVAPNLLGLARKHWGLGITPKIVLRLFVGDESAPVRHPSYMPRVTLYAWGNWLPGSATRDHFLFSSLTVSHHSNGQSGDFYLPDDGSGALRVNTVDGSFSTNFIEPALTLVRMVGGEVRTNRLAFRIPLGHINEDEDLRTGPHQYGRYRISLSGSDVVPRHPIVPGWIGKLRFAGDLTYIMDRSFSKRLDDGKRFMGTFAWTIGPEFLNEFALFVGYHFGQDYYNINYVDRVQLLRFGLMIGSVTDVVRQSGRF
jgi:hypothetical protein